MSEIEKRKVSDRDGNILVGIGGAAFKAAYAGMALVASGPATINAIGLTVAATFAADLTGTLIEERKEHLRQFARSFSKCTSTLTRQSQERIREQSDTAAGNRIWEIAWHQAAKEIDPEKLDLLAALLKNGLSSEELREHQTRWLLRLLDELDTFQIVILQSFSTQFKNDGAFRAQHEEIFENESPPAPPRFDEPRLFSFALSQQGQMTDEKKLLEENSRKKLDAARLAFEAELPRLTKEYQLARERHALFQSRLHRLVELGLLGVVRTHTSHSEIPAVSQSLTPLGAAMLKIIDLIDDSEWGSGEQVNAVQAIEQAVRDINHNNEVHESALEKSLRSFQR